ncbi:GerAB/ArcD/ProY family transporter [Paenibacillus solisilvae]|uniref:GerAB/ArcD/ProY family transporter n=1 Tax=Paenibacillus solisilvae TaxID=2486751 RepID=A0ABW0W393_9BACL
MNRYFYYNVFLVSLLNLMLFVPHILLRFRYDGAVSSMGVAIVIGSSLALMFTKVMKSFPGKGLPEILAEFFPKFVIVPFLLFMAVLWLVASSIALVSYAVLINRFFNPDTSPIVVLAFLCLICIYTSSRSTLTVIFVIEIGLIINAPLLLFILIKATRSTAIDWDAIRTIANYWTKPPKLQPVSAATYVFTGYINYAIYNRLNPPNFRIRYRWLIPLTGTFILLMTFFVPIGFHGTETVDNYLYIWSVTADSMLMGYGFIERVMFFFLLLYLNLTLIYTTSGWHQAMEFVKSCLPKSSPQVDCIQTPKKNWIITSVFAVITLTYSILLNEKENFSISSYWLTFRMFIEIGSVLFLFVLAFRRKTST